MSNNFIRAMLIRALRTFCQVAVASIGAKVTFGQIDWCVVLSTSLLSALLSMLTSLAGLPEVKQTVDEDIDKEVIEEETIEEVQTGE